MTKSTKANVFIISMLGLGGAILFTAIANGRCSDPARYLCYFILAIVSSGMKVSLPSITGTMSVAFLFTLLGIEELSLPETLLMISTATLVQCTWRTKGLPHNNIYH